MNKFPYQIIFHTSENDKDVLQVPSILGSMTMDNEPTEVQLIQYMSDYEGCTFCEVYYDKYQTEEYDQLVFTYSLVD